MLNTYEGTEMCPEECYILLEYVPNGVLHKHPKQQQRPDADAWTRKHARSSGIAHQHVQHHNTTPQHNTTTQHHNTTPQHTTPQHHNTTLQHNTTTQHHNNTTTRTQYKQHIHKYNYANLHIKQWEEITKTS
jgi:hypothetical protein